MNAPGLALKKTFEINPLNAGYLFSSFPPTINLITFVSGWTMSYLVDWKSYYPYLMNPNAYFAFAL